MTDTTGSWLVSDEEKVSGLAAGHHDDDHDEGTVC